MATPTSIDYTNRDYDSLLAELQQRARTLLPDWDSTNPNDIGVILMELFAYMGDGIHYYIDRVANEAHIRTAVLPSTVRDIARSYGYEPKSVQNSTGQVTFTKTTTAAGVISIPAGTVVRTGYSGSYASFVTTEAASLDTGTASTVDVLIAQGRDVTDEDLGVSTGSPLQRVALANAGVDHDTVSVQVGGQVWRRVISLLDQQRSDAVYQLFDDTVGNTYVMFGDGYSGAVPVFGASVTATYRYCDGAGGNVTADTITVIETAIDGIASVTNTSPTSGGSDQENDAQIRAALPLSLRAINRVVSAEDAESLVLQVPGVALTQAVSLIWSAVNVYVASSGGAAPTTTLEDEIEEYMAGKMLIGAALTVLDPTFIDIDMALTVYVLPNYLQQTVEDTVNATLNALFAFPNFGFADPVNVGVVYRAVTGVEGVDYVDVTSMYKSGETVVLNSTLALSDGEIAQKGVFTVTMSGGVT